MFRSQGASYATCMHVDLEIASRWGSHSISVIREVLLSLRGRGGRAAGKALRRRHDATDLVLCAISSLCTSCKMESAGVMFKDVCQTSKKVSSAEMKELLT